MTAAADRPAGEAALPSAIAAEVERQQRAIMRGASFGDEETRRTMEGELRQRLAHSLQTGRPLRVYLGVDPTAPDLHLGHCVSLRKLRTFQDLGHHSILLIGDFTGLVGDPSDKEALRPMAGAEALEANARTYRAQALKVLDPERTELRRNSEWLSRLTFRDLIDLASRFTVAPNISASCSTSPRRLPSSAHRTGAAGSMLCRSRNRGPSPLLAPDSTTGCPTKLHGRSAAVNNGGSNGSSASRW